VCVEQDVATIYGVVKVPYTTKVDAILGEEDRAIDQVEPTTHHICCGEGGTILLPRTRGAEHTAIICMEAIGVLLPALYVWVCKCAESE